MKKNKKNESGRSIIEMLGVLALLMLLTLGGLQLFGQMQASVIAKDLTSAIVEEALIRQHALKGKPSNKKDTISRQGPHGISFEIENGVDGDMDDYFWVKTDALSQEVCEDLLKKVQELQNGENNNNLGLLAVMDEDGKRVTSCPSKADKQMPSLQYLFQKNPGYHLGLVTWKIPGCDEERVMPNGGFIDNEQLECHAGYYKTGSGCDVTCKVCPENTISDEKATECVDCGEAKANEIHTECICEKENAPCEDEEGAYNEDCTCVPGLCYDDTYCNVGKKCDTNEHTCTNCISDEECPTCVAEDPLKPYWSDTECVECIKDEHCGDNKYCTENHTCVTACTDGQSEYDKTTQKCVCQNYGGSYARGSASTCVTCEGTIPYYDEGTNTCVECTTPAHCANDKTCTNNTCKDACEGFRPSECTKSCQGVNHKPYYTYQNCEEDLTDGRWCSCLNKETEGEEFLNISCREDDGYRMDKNGECVTGCDGFTPTTCITACEETTKGSSLTHAAQGTSCGTNQVCNGSGSCVCAAGYYLQNGVCVACQIGTYKNTIGNDACSACSSWRANTTTTTTGNTATTQCLCKAGYYLQNGVCVACQIGTYKNTIGNNACSACSSWRANTTTTTTGNTATTQCLCRAGYYLNGSTCTACPNSSSKSAVSNAGSCTCSWGSWNSSSKKCCGQVTESYTCDNKHGSHISYSWLKAHYNCYSFGTTTVSKCEKQSGSHKHYWCMSHDTCTRTVISCK